MSNITDKVVVITGASSGIGESTAKLLAQQGAKVVLGARRSNRIDALVQEISAAGGKVIGLATDVTKRAEVEALIKRAIDSFGRVDVLRMELHSQNIRCTMISPGAVATELAESSSDEATRKNLREFMKMAIPADSIARAIAYAIEQPANVEIDEIVVRPTAQDF